MDEDELAKAMDEEHGPGAWERWKVAITAEEQAVEALAGRIGYGRTMQLCEKLWRAKLATDGLEGGEHSTGPCVSFLVPCPCKGERCDWCCGANRVTQPVAQAMVLRAELAVVLGEEPSDEHG